MRESGSNENVLNEVEAEKEDVLPSRSHLQDQSICHSTAFGGDHFTVFFFFFYIYFTAFYGRGEAADGSVLHKHL